MSSLVLLSGGLDSTTVLSMVTREDNSVEAIGFEYGQRHSAEIESAKAVADHFGVPFTLMPATMQQGTSVLMDDKIEMPHLTYEEIEKSEGVSPTYVPFRNGTFLALAAGFCLDKGIERIFMGVHAEDARGWAYPDCTPEFIGAMANAIYVGTYHQVRLYAPLQYHMKADVVQVGLRFNAPYHLTLSCYEGKRPACGRCPTCIGRLEAFKANGVEDPIEYEIDVYGPYNRTEGATHE